MKVLAIIKFFFIAVPVAVLLFIICETYFKIKAIKRDVLTPLGYGKAIAWIDYGTDTNTIWKVVCYDTGRVRNFYDDDILVYPNEMDGGKVDENYFSKREFHETNQSFIKGLKNHFKPKPDAE
jgi:hypothetical protein